jgi:hypothetical protein
MRSTRLGAKPCEIRTHESNAGGDKERAILSSHILAMLIHQSVLDAKITVPFWLVHRDQFARMDLPAPRGGMTLRTTPGTLVLGNLEARSVSRFN